LSLPKGVPPKVGDPTEKDGVKGKKVGNGCLGYFVKTTDKVESVTPINGAPTALTDTGTLTVASHVVPEPPAVSLLAAGLLALAGVVGLRERRIG
jgi:MYXO-CTERM domain-containing protein